MYNEQLNRLFDKWRENHIGFCSDGLVMKFGEPRESVDEKWDKAERRVAFILKDNPDGSSTDLRTWLIEGPESKQCRELRGGRIGRTGFLPNIARMFYGLYVSPETNYKDLNPNETRNVWNDQPFALIEFKKMAGGTSIANSVLNHVAEEEADMQYLKEELDILNPNVIVCCDPSGTIFDTISQFYEKESGNEIIRKEYEYENDGEIVPGMKCRAWYFRKMNVIVILSFHPTRGRKSDWMIYHRVISPFRAFLRENIVSFKPSNRIK